VTRLGAPLATNVKQGALAVSSGRQRAAFASDLGLIVSMRAGTIRHALKANPTGTAKLRGGLRAGPDGPADRTYGRAGFRSRSGSEDGTSK